MPVVYTAATGAIREIKDVAGWSIDRVYAANSSGEIICRAKNPDYQMNANMICRLNHAAGLGGETIAPIIPSSLTFIYDVNELGTICGYINNRAFRMASSQTEPSYLFPEGGTSVARAVNDDGEVVGQRNGMGFRYTPVELAMWRGWNLENPPYGVLNAEGSAVVLDELPGYVASTGVTNVNLPKVINNWGHFAGERHGNTYTTKGRPVLTIHEMYAYQFLDQEHYGFSGLDQLLLRESLVEGINDEGDITGRAGWDYGHFLYMHDEYLLMELAAGWSVLGPDQNRFADGAVVNCVKDNRVMAGTLNESIGQQVFVLTPRSN